MLFWGNYNGWFLMYLFSVGFTILRLYMTYIAQKSYKEAGYWFDEWLNSTIHIIVFHRQFTIFLKNHILYSDIVILHNKKQFSHFLLKYGIIFCVTENLLFHYLEKGHLYKYGCYAYVSIFMFIIRTKILYIYKKVH